MRFVSIVVALALVGACTPRARPYATGAGLITAAIGTALVVHGSGVERCERRNPNYPLPDQEGNLDQLVCGAEHGLQILFGGAMVLAGVGLLLAAAVSSSRPDPTSARALPAPVAPPVVPATRVPLVPPAGASSRTITLRFE